jgi:hypothetical protein
MTPASTYRSQCIVTANLVDPQRMLLEIFRQSKSIGANPAALAFRHGERVMASRPDAT